jgi:cobyrinic acid a,c-diamide synthase
VTPGVLISAPASGSGKTVVTLALLRTLARGGVAVASAKVGPDYIDPAFHAAASGRPCINLDGWAMRPATLDRLIRGLGEGSELIVGEGVMGLFDGAGLPEAGGTADDGPKDSGRKDSGLTGDGSTADLAARTGWPVVLVVDVRGQAASAAATLAGFVRHRARVTVAGVVFNRVGGESHARTLRQAAADTVPEVAVLGCIPRDTAFALPERHLGLVQAAERECLDRFLDAAADHLARHLDLDALRGLARRLDPDACRAGAGTAGPPIPPLGQRIAIARDVAFAFVYEATLEGWRRAGATLSFFSPLAGEGPAADADAIYLPGGYPELHAGRIAANRPFLDGLRAAAARGAFLLGECGGYMALGEVLVDGEGAAHAMAGLLPLETSFAAPRLHLGYRALRLAHDCPLGPRGRAFRGHEFHYAATMRAGEAEPLFEAADARGKALGPVGLARGTVAGSFIHLVDRADA